MAQGTLDQQQTTSTSSFGFGQTSGPKYRGQVFTCGISGRLGTLGFNRTKGSLGLKVYIDTVDGSNLPVHAFGSELYSWEITNASVVNLYGEYDLPVPQTLVAGTKYCFYIAPWNTSTHLYQDDYQDAHGVNSGSLEITYNTVSWTIENGLTWNYKTYMITSKLASKSLLGVGA